MGEYQSLKFIPEDIASMRIDCTDCNKPFKPDFLKPRNEPVGAIETEWGYWQQKTITEKCPNCHSANKIELPAKQPHAKVLLFGDEAIRILNKKGGRMYTYSLVGTSLPQVKRIENSIKELKINLVPHMNPEEWKIHMTTIWSGQQRKKRPEYKHWNLEKTKQLIYGIKYIFELDENIIFRYNIFLAGQPQNKKDANAFEKHVQHEAYILLIMSVIKEVTGFGSVPEFYFDSIKPAKSDIVIHEWAKKSFEHGSSNLLYSLISHSMLIPEPIFVPPASRPFLELADVMSFMVARYHYRIYNNRGIDIDLSSLGKVMYMTFSKDGNRLLQKRTIGYPWNMNFGY